MGIKLLNSLIKKRCGNMNNLISLYRLKGKIITIDISIYLYRFKSVDKLMENMYILCSLMCFYEIKPLFIFDGIPSHLKNDELELRKKKKMEAKKKFDQLKLKNGSTKRIERLKRMFTSINKVEIEGVKKLIKLFGLSYITAEGEADEICAKLVISNQAYACLSEDTDLFVYGCPRVLRYISLRNHTVVIYHTDKILSELKLNMERFRKMCVISGTDYNNNCSNYNIFYYYDIYKDGGNIELTPDEITIYNIYDLNDEKVFDNLLIENGSINKSGIYEIMSKYNFISI